MTIKQHEQKSIQVWADWTGITAPLFMGTLFTTPSRGKEIFSFEYDPAWLRTARQKSSQAQIIDPDLSLFSGPQYARDNRNNFGIFLDSSPDRWGRVLMQRRESQLAKTENRAPRLLMESDYLLGVHDGHRMGGLRFKLSKNGPYLDNQTDMAAPPWAQLRDLEYASLQLERDNAEAEPNYMKWVKLLIAPGGSLGGARPKASIVDETGHPWIAKFPSRQDDTNIGKWEYLVYRLAQVAGIGTAPARIQRFSGTHDTFLTKRFDRTSANTRIHFASAMTLLGKKDGDNGDTGVSYLDLVDFIIKHGAQVNHDLEQLWRRILFYVCVSNTDDHLRNHGFLLQESGWVLAPAYDINAVATGNGLSLNISRTDNDQNIALVHSVAEIFRLNNNRAAEITTEVTAAVRGWRDIAQELRLSNHEIGLMQNAFRISYG